MALFRSALYGLLAGAAGTLAMDLTWYVRYRRGGGSTSFLAWETAEGLRSWNDASAPAKVGKLLYETIIHRELPPSQARVTTNVMHWSYGVQWGAVLSTALGSSRHVRIWHAPLFGALVWLASYLELPIAGFYKPIWEYDWHTLWQDLSAHLVYGTACVLTFWRMFRP